MNHLVFVGALLVSSAAPPPAHDVDAIDQTRDEVQAHEQFAFCTDPKRPLGARAQGLCATGHELSSCQGFIAACDAGVIEPPPDWLTRLLVWIGPLATVFLYLLVGLIAVAIAIPIVNGLLQLRKRRKKAAMAKLGPNVAQVMTEVAVPAPDETDPEEALRQAEAYLARGEHRRALSFSLTAALGALDRSGSIRVAKHRTNGEYVRSCIDEAARPPLREIVRAVDAVEFGGAEATTESAARITARAKEIVRAAAFIATLGLLALGCDPPKPGADPAGDELPVAVLERNGFKIKPLSTSLSTMPVPENNEGAPAVLIDVERVPLDGETQAHLMRWVEGGGVLILLGKVDGWPSELGARFAVASTRDLFVTAPDPNGGLEDLDSDESNADVGKPILFGGARLASQETFTWKTEQDEETIALLGKEPYASKRRVGKGIVLGIGSDNLFTNIGIMPKHNAAALVTILRSATHDPRRQMPLENGKIAIGDLRIARAEDGIPPPSSPFAALIAAGLAKGAWHALLAAILLFLAYGIRHARPRAAPRAPRRSFVEHVEATGAFYARARPRAHALHAYGRFLELRLREVAPRGADPALFLAARSGRAPERVAELYARALAGSTEEFGDELEVIAELRTMLAQAVTERPSRARAE